MRYRRSAGTLMIIGGSEKREETCEILSEFIRLAGGSQSRIAIMPVATRLCEEVGIDYTKAFDRLGAGHSDVVDVRSRDDANKPMNLELIERATGVFFTGGDQFRITSLLGGTRMDDVLHDRFDDGMLLGGTSAGAVMMPGTMIVGGISGASPRFGSVDMAPGMEFIGGVVIESHFSQRGRLGRLIGAVAQYPHDIGLGIDEDTALVVREGVFTVYGSGSVTVVDAGTVHYTNLPELARDEPLAIAGVSLHVLPAGFRYDLENRKILQGVGAVEANGHLNGAQHGTKRGIIE